MKPLLHLESALTLKIRVGIAYQSSIFIKKWCTLEIISVLAVYSADQSGRHDAEFQSVASLVGYRFYPFGL